MLQPAALVHEVTNLLRWGIERRAENQVANVIRRMDPRDRSLCFHRTSLNPGDKLKGNR